MIKMQTSLTKHGQKHWKKNHFRIYLWLTRSRTSHCIIPGVKKSQRPQKIHSCFFYYIQVNAFHCWNEPKWKWKRNKNILNLNPVLMTRDFVWWLLDAEVVSCAWQGPGRRRAGGGWLGGSWRWLCCSLFPHTRSRWPWHSWCRSSPRTCRYGHSGHMSAQS